MTPLGAIALGMLGCAIIVALGIAGAVAGSLDVGLGDPRLREEEDRERERQRRWRALRDGDDGAAS